MRGAVLGTVIAALLLSGSSAARAQSTVTTITVSGSPGALDITSAIPGSAPTSVSDATTTYTTVVKLKGTNAGKHVDITGQLSAAMPAGVTLTITMAAPPGGTSAGAVNLSTTAQNLVTAVPNGGNGTQGITYQLSATPAAGVITSRSTTVTFTMVIY